MALPVRTGGAEDSDGEGGMARTNSLTIASLSAATGGGAPSQLRETREESTGSNKGGATSAGGRKLSSLDAFPVLVPAVEILGKRTCQKAMTGPEWLLGEMPRAVWHALSPS